jgi:hypothetical protein
MPAHLLAQPRGHAGRDPADVGRLDAAGPVDVDLERRRDAPGPAREHDDAVCQA